MQKLERLKYFEAILHKNLYVGIEYGLKEKAFKNISFTITEFCNFNLALSLNKEKNCF